jgi:hypothetical protein
VISAGKPRATATTAKAKASIITTLDLAGTEREAELLPVPYYHLVFTLPAAIADIAYQNKAVIYDLLFKASAETVITIAADPKHLGARVGITAVLQPMHKSPAQVSSSFRRISSSEVR